MLDLTSVQVQDFIRNFEGDPLELILKGSPFEGVDVKVLAQQIQGRRQIRKKLPLWYNRTGVLYPPGLNLEQTSSQATAQYKASLCEGSAGADLTGGWGVDTFYLSGQFDHFDYFEEQTSLAEMAQYNSKLLGRSNIDFNKQDGIEGIAHKRYDWIYLDPSRRHEEKGKVIQLQDYAPNVVEQLEYLLERCRMLMVKTAPMYDISKGLKELNHVKEVQVVAVGNEVKELLWLIEPNYSGAPSVKAIILNNSISEFAVRLPIASPIKMDLPSTYVYEPHAALLKAGMHDLIATDRQLYKLAKNSQLYTASQLVDFPGRRYKLLKIHPYKKAQIKKELAGKKALVVARNFGETVAQLRKRWRLEDAEGMQLIFTRLEDGEKVVLEVERLS